MKSTCVSTSQRMRPGTASFLPKARLESRMEQFQARLEGRAVASPVELGRDEREDHAGQLLVQLVRFRTSEAGLAEGADQRVPDRECVLACERAREEGDGPRVREQHLPGRTGELG